MRIAVYTDYVYRRVDGAVYADRAFATFLAGVGAHLDRMVVVGRLDPDAGESHYRLPPDVEFVPLAYYRSLAAPVEMGVALARSLGRFWRVLDDVDGAWLLGPHPVALAFAAVAALRRRRVILGVRQDTVRYVRERHPGRRWIALAAQALDGAYRALARVVPVAVVGGHIAARYSRARRLLEMRVSLVPASRIAAPEVGERSYDGDLRILSVGRLEREKNPLLLADVLARLRASDPRWRLIVHGEGPLEGALRERLEALQVAGHAELRGYVPLGQGLLDTYRDSHVLLHVSLTEGVPQVLFEAFASRLPVVATAVGGVPRAAEGAALLVPPRDPATAAAALRRVAADGPLRERLIEAGAAIAGRHTVEAETLRVARFLAGDA